jgi:type II secretory pathway pseudopilin PulG
MKKNKAFTLIELLAIIVILAVIAVITVPIILNVIENAEIGAAQNSAYGYKDALNKYYVKKLSEDSNFKMNGQYTINNDGSLSDEERNYSITLSGTIPKTGFATLKNGILESGCIQINEYAVTFSDSKVISTRKEICRDPNFVEEFPQVEDTYPGIICGNGSTEDYQNSDTCYINSVEDLVAFSNMVTGGNSFSGKTVELTNNLDIQDTKSYINSETTAFNDINGNSTTESLIEELTNDEAKGFKSIGNSNYRFSGTFKGNGHVIKNLFINRSDDSYLGLFGYNEGTIRELELKNAYVKGASTVGLLVGQNIGTIRNIIVDGDATTTGNRVGLICGFNNNNVSQVVARGNVKGDRYVGGIVGCESSGTINAAYIGGTITVQSGYANLGGRIYGANEGSTPGGTSIALSSVKINDTEAQESTMNGFSISQLGLNGIAAYDMVLDTYIGGDNDGDGYYYDFDRSGNIELYKLSDKPLRITMNGTGTEGDEYIITSYEELKQVAYAPDKHYKLDTDIDFDNNKQLMLSNTTVPFTGVFDGQDHKLENLRVEGVNYIGLFGQNNGTIKNLEIDEPYLKGNQYAGTVVGYNNKIVKNIKITDLTALVDTESGGVVGYNNSYNSAIIGVWVSGNVIGSNTVGLLVGRNQLGGISTVVAEGNVTITGNKAGIICGYNNNTIDKVVVKGNVTGDRHVGGIVGWENSGLIKAAYINGSITVLSGYDNLGARIYGAWDGYWPVLSSIALDTITINNNAPSNTGISTNNGQSYTAQELLTQTPYAQLPLNFTDETSEYIWYFDNNNLTFRKN